MTSQVATSQGQGSGWRNAFRAIGETLIGASTAARCAREAERLFELSDAELARLGLTRDQIVHHAFRRYMTI
jgi:hypothetical protein